MAEDTLAFPGVLTTHHSELLPGELQVIGPDQSFPCFLQVGQNLPKSIAFFFFLTHRYKLGIFLKAYGHRMQGYLEVS